MQYLTHSKNIKYHRSQIQLVICVSMCE